MTLWRAIASLCLAVAFGALAYLVFAEAATQYEMLATGASNRSELGEDMALGMLGLLVVLPASCCLGALAGWYVMRRFNRRPPSL